MTKFTISDSEKADLIFSREREMGSRIESLELNMMTGQSIQEPKSWEEGAELDRYFDIVLRIIDHIWENPVAMANTHDDNPGFISSPQSDKHQFLKWLLVEELPKGTSQWVKGFRQALKNAQIGDTDESDSRT